MSFKNFIYTKDDEDLTFLPKDFSPGFNTGSSSVSINTKPIRADEEHAVKPKTKHVTEPMNKRVGTITDLGGVPKEILLLFTLGVLRPTLRRESAKQWEGFLDNHLDVDLLDLHDHCYAWQAVLDNAVNRRFCKLLEIIAKLRENMSSLATEVKEHKGNVDRLMLESQKWSGYQEIEEVKYVRKEVVSKVVPYACMEVLHSDELVRLM
nr:hypothetical protein [Tanacetum cinerariifolium]GEW07934.1 hypothetical protein [Tanacetum cinerariifolium]GEW16382.1 hypothetical protein [Tanacetum cinerariifolium]